MQRSPTAATTTPTFSPPSITVAAEDWVNEMIFIKHHYELCIPDGVCLLAGICTLDAICRFDWIWGRIRNAGIWVRRWGGVILGRETMRWVGGFCGHDRFVVRRDL